MNATTIKEKYIEDYPIPITLESTEIILSQMKSSVCKIYLDSCGRYANARVIIKMYNGKTIKLPYYLSYIKR